MCLATIEHHVSGLESPLPIYPKAVAVHHDISRHPLELRKVEMVLLCLLGISPHLMSLHALLHLQMLVYESFYLQKGYQRVADENRKITKETSVVELMVGWEKVHCNLMEGLLL